MSRLFTWSGMVGQKWGAAKLVARGIHLKCKSAVTPSW